MFRDSPTVTTSARSLAVGRGRHGYTVLEGSFNVDTAQRLIGNLWLLWHLHDRDGECIVVAVTLLMKRSEITKQSLRSILLVS